MPETESQRQEPGEKSRAAAIGSGGAGSSYPRTIVDLLPFLVPFLLLSTLALGGGGYDVLPLHLTGIAAWIVFALLLLAPIPGAPPGRSFALVGGLILALCLLSALSTIWSVSVTASVADAGRILAYLGFFSVSYLVARTPEQRKWFARGILGGITVVLLLAIGDRLVPGGEPTVDGFAFNRLSYPLGYWNGNGIVFAIGFAFYVWFAGQTSSRRWRLALVAMSTLASAALYLTYSRGGLLVGISSLVLLCFLSGQRLRILGISVISIAAAAPVLFVITSFPTVSGTSVGDPTTGESLLAAAGILLFLAVAASLVEAGLALARRNPRRAGKAVAISRDRRLLAALAGGLATLMLAGLLFFGNEAWEQFSDGDIPATRDQSSRFTELSGAYRYDFMGVALDTFAGDPSSGTGAGTWSIAWTRERDKPVVSQDAHSFYLQSLSDLGVAGGLITLGLAITLIAFAIIVYRRGREREAPLVLAVTTTFLIALSLDWFWRLGATAALLLLLGAWITGNEPWRSPAVAMRSRSAGSPAAMKVAGLLAAWVAIVCLAVPAIADHYQEAAADSVRAGKLEKAIDQSDTAAKLEPWAAEPHMQLGTIAESRGQVGQALAEYDRAIELEPGNWRAVVLRFRLNYGAGRLAAAASDLRIMQELNPVFFQGLTLRQVGRLAS